MLRAPEARELEALRARLRAGRYQPDAAKVADRIVEESYVLALRGKR
jgi:anti-sigma28 factor (negative regulator of flagellin synthesis)